MSSSEQYLMSDLSASCHALDFNLLMALKASASPVNANYFMTDYS